MGCQWPPKEPGPWILSSSSREEGAEIGQGMDGVALLSLFLKEAEKKPGPNSWCTDSVLSPPDEVQSSEDGCASLQGALSNIPPWLGGPGQVARCG